VDSTVEIAWARADDDPVASPVEFLMSSPNASAVEELVEVPVASTVFSLTAEALEEP
jgi:hypothetical protein